MNGIRDAEDASHIQLHGTGAVQSLERQLAEHFEVRHALCVSSCSMGLLTAALALGLRDREILAPPLLYGGAISGLLLLGNHLRFCDVDPVTLTLDPKCVRSSITKNSKAILAVDLFGVPSDSAELRQIADEYGLHLISDSAQSLGASRDGRSSGYRSDATVVSFTSGKTLFAGEGGAVMTDDSQLYRKLLWHSQHPHRQRREISLDVYNEVNLNGRINPLAAIWADRVFETALETLAKWQERCLELIACLNEEGITEPLEYDHIRIVPAFFRLTTSLRHGHEAPELEEVLRRRGFMVRICPAAVHPIYNDPAFRLQFARRIAGAGSCPVADAQSQSRVAIEFDRLKPELRGARVDAARRA